MQSGLGQGATESGMSVSSGARTSSARRGRCFEAQDFASFYRIHHPGGEHWGGEGVPGQPFSSEIP